MEKIIEEVKTLVVSQWKDCGVIRPYVEEKIFELFRHAYDKANESKARMITGDMLTAELAFEIYANDDDKPALSKDYFIEKFTLKWDAWCYALDNYPHRHPEMME